MRSHKSLGAASGATLEEGNSVTATAGMAPAVPLTMVGEAAAPVVWSADGF